MEFFIAVVVTVDEWRVGFGGGRGGEEGRGGREIRIKEDIAIDRVKLKMKRDFFEFQKFINAF